MKKYLVVALSVGALSNKIFNSGEEVSEEAFEPGRADELVKKGFLKELSTDEPENFEGELDNGLNQDDPEALPGATGSELYTDEPENIEPVQPANVETIEMGDQANDKVLDSVTAESNEVQTIPDFDKITKNEIIKSLKEKGIEFDVNSSKKELFDQLYTKN